MEWRISSVFSGEGCAGDSDVCSGEVTCTGTGDVWFRAGSGAGTDGMCADSTVVRGIWVTVDAYVSATSVPLRE